jgi:cell division protein FtsA
MSNSPKGTYAVGLDVGSAWTRCVICEVQDDGLDFLGHGLFESKGWVKGRVSDQKAISESIRWAVQMAECQALVSVSGVVTGLGGGGIDGMTSRGVYEFGRPRQIDAGDMSYVIKQAADVKLEHDRMILQACPQDFIVDGRANIRNPKGMSAQRLEAHVYLITASEQEHNVILSSVHEAHLALDESIAESVAASYCATNEAEREHGVAVIDIGAHTTDVAIYHGEALAGSFSIGIGGDHFSRDLAYFLTCAPEDAQLLKEEFGSALLGQASGSTLIEVPGHDGRPAREISRWQIMEILEARAEQLFKVIRKEIAALGIDGTLQEGVVLTGGGAKLPGMLDIAERELNCPSRNGLPENINNWPEELMSPDWTTAAGLTMYAGRLKMRRDGKRKTPRLLNLVLR